ncbi:Lebercilin domain-containing protein [Chloropicon primus]|uniref:Lebercilin domain-containing protein n=1 Tax=Chloropicon primus TaxID=1764295 RepID=A0A5B8MWK7_9CHLO|nr:hypothetical protein A3770_11p63580 [Chloropicon primus]UPR03053.1 Lebercilin domain-containing protein [Chloropicon primus]|eukprot:QDZ23840.1 hypothetical protein A3770_11p63580 [Chloropicon primus]
MANESPTKGNASPRYKSQHLNTIRSMHMIQELQSYIENLENLAQQQKEEIHRVNEQNKVWKRQTKNPAVRSKLGEEFAGDGTDLPPKLRAIIEDNRVLRDRAKKYKEEASKTSQTVKAQEQQLLKLKDKVSALNEKLASLTKSHGDSLTQEQLQEKLEEQERSLRDFEHRVEVLTKSKETEGKKFRHSLNAANKKVKERDSQIASLQQDIENKDKEVRAKNLECKAVQRKLTEQKSLTLTLRKTAEALRNAENTTSASEGGGAQQDEKEKEKVKSVVINTGGKGEGGEAGGSAPAKKSSMTTDGAATIVQSKYRGYQARKTTDKMKKEREEAATRIQAVHRGRMARRKSQQEREIQLGEKAEESKAQQETDTKEEEAAMKIQSKARGMLAKKKVQKMKEEKAQEVMPESPEQTVVSKAPKATS